MALVGDDCFFFLNAGCVRGSTCTFRHQPAARNTAIICPQWLQRSCFKPNCGLRHTNEHVARDTREQTRCYFETTFGYCTKPGCAFAHMRKSNGPVPTPVIPPRVTLAISVPPAAAAAIVHPLPINTPVVIREAAVVAEKDAIPPPLPPPLPAHLPNAKMAPVFIGSRPELQILPSVKDEAVAHKVQQPVARPQVVTVPPPQNVSVLGPTPTNVFPKNEHFSEQVRRFKEMLAAKTGRKEKDDDHSGDEEKRVKERQRNKKERREREGYKPHKSNKSSKDVWRKGDEEILYGDYKDVPLDKKSKRKKHKEYKEKEHADSDPEIKVKSYEEILREKALRKLYSKRKEKFNEDFQQLVRDELNRKNQVANEIDVKVARKHKKYNSDGDEVVSDDSAPHVENYFKRRHSKSDDSESASKEKSKEKYEEKRSRKKEKRESDRDDEYHNEYHTKDNDMDAYLRAAVLNSEKRHLERQSKKHKKSKKRKRRERREAEEEDEQDSSIEVITSDSQKEDAELKVEKEKHGKEDSSQEEEDSDECSDVDSDSSEELEETNNKKLEVVTARKEEIVIPDETTNIDFGVDCDDDLAKEINETGQNGNVSTKHKKISSVVSIINKVSNADNRKVPLSDNRKALSDNRKAPSSDNRKAPSSDNRKAPSSDNRKAPSSDNRKAPPSDNRKAPSSDNRKAPSSDNRKAPLSDNRKAPSFDNRNAPSFDNRNAPSSDNRKAPSSDNRKAPSSDNRKAPSSDNRKAPSSDNRKEPSSDNRKEPSSDNRKRPTSDNRKRDHKKATESSDYIEANCKSKDIKTDLQSKHTNPAVPTVKDAKGDDVVSPVTCNSVKVKTFEEIMAEKQRRNVKTPNADIVTADNPGGSKTLNATLKEKSTQAKMEILSVAGNAVTSSGAASNAATSSGVDAKCVASKTKSLSDEERLLKRKSLQLYKPPHPGDTSAPATAEVKMVVNTGPRKIIRIRKASLSTNLIDQSPNGESCDTIGDDTNPGKEGVHVRSFEEIIREKRLRQKKEHALANQLEKENTVKETHGGYANNLIRRKPVLRRPTAPTVEGSVALVTTCTPSKGVSSVALSTASATVNHTHSQQTTKVTESSKRSTIIESSNGARVSQRSTNVESSNVSKVSQRSTNLESTNVAKVSPLKVVPQKRLNSELPSTNVAGRADALENKDFYSRLRTSSRRSSVSHASDTQKDTVKTSPVMKLRKRSVTSTAEVSPVPINRANTQKITPHTHESSVTGERTEHKVEGHGSARKDIQKALDEEKRKREEDLLSDDEFEKEINELCSDDDEELDDINEDDLMMELEQMIDS